MSMQPEKYSFYRPHNSDDTAFTGAVVDPLTGEVSYPPSMTKQSEAAACDINNILKEFQLTGQIRHISDNAQKGIYTDLPDGLDYQESLNIVLEGQRAFDSLPSAVRNRFANDPQLFLEFMADPANVPEMIKLGLATEKPGAEPVTPPTEATPSPGAGGTGG